MTDRDHDQRLVYEVPEAGAMLGLSRNASYEAARRGDIPTIKIGKLLRVPKAAFNQMLERGGRQMIEAIIIVTSPAIRDDGTQRGDFFEVQLAGRDEVLCVSRQPLLDASRILSAQGANP